MVTATPLQLKADGECWVKAVLETDMVWRGQATCGADLSTKYNQMTLTSP